MKKLGLYCKDFWRYRHLLNNLISRDIKVKYRRSALGLLWSVLNPLLMMMVMYVVFSQIFHMTQMNRGNVEVNFAVYLLTGQLIYNFFSEATQTAMGSVLGSAQLIKKVYIPKYIFPLEKVAFSFVIDIRIADRTRHRDGLHPHAGSSDGAAGLDPDGDPVCLQFWHRFDSLCRYSFFQGYYAPLWRRRHRVDVSHPDYVRCQHPARLGAVGDSL